jgi:hypothetical protein
VSGAFRTKAVAVATEFLLKGRMVLTQQEEVAQGKRPLRPEVAQGNALPNLIDS